MQKKNIFFKIWNAFENSFLSNHKCICCFREILDETEFMFCNDCKDNLEFLGNNVCKKCGDNLNAAGNCINDCVKNRYSFRSNFSVFYYTGSAANIIKNLKYGNHKYISKYVADVIASYNDKFENADIITFVPSSKSRLRERGFNQSEEIVKHLGEKFNIKVLPLLIKSKDTIHQAGNTKKDRLKNLIGSFEFNDKFATEVEGKNILIVDDVFTTGATLNECSKVVKKFKAMSVGCLTFAKTKFNLTKENF